MGIRRIWFGKMMMRMSKWSHTQTADNKLEKQLHDTIVALAGCQEQRRVALPVLSLEGCNQMSKGDRRTDGIGSPAR